MTRAMAERYGDHPALALWHVSNEYGDHVSRCWCPESSAHFRRWLEARYGDLDGLNEAWGVNVWGQRYTAWEHIEAPRRATGPVNPTQLLDFERFSSDALLELFQLEIDVLREVTPDIAVTTNFMSLLRDLDYWDFAAVEDLVTDDAYPDPADPLAHVPAALNYGLMRSLKGGQPWLLLEQAASAVSWRDVNVPKAPGQMRIDSLQAIAHGSDGAMFFQWRQAKYGQEKFHSAMLGHRGEASRSFQETKAFGAELQRLAAGARHPRARPRRARRRLGLVVGIVGRRVAAVAATELARAGARLERRALRARPPGRHRARHRSVRRLRRRRGAEPLHRGCRAGRRAHRVRRARRPARRRPVLGRRRRHREGARRRRARPAARSARRRGRRALADPRWRARNASSSPALEFAEILSGASGSNCTRAPRCSRATPSGELAGRAAATRRARADGDGAAWYLSAVLEPAGHDRAVPRGARRPRTARPRAHRTPTSRS